MKISKKMKAIFVLCFIIVLFTFFGYKFYQNNNESVIVNNANLYLNSGKYELALQNYNKVKSNLDILHKKEICEMKLEKFKEALNSINLIEQELVKSPNNELLVSVKYDKVICLYQLIENEEAIKESKNFFTLSKDKIRNSVIQYYTINAYFNLKDYNGCIQDINSFLASYDERKEEDIKQINKLNAALFDCYVGIKDYTKAMEINDSLLKGEPDNIQLYIDRAALLSQAIGRKSAYDYLVSIEKEKFPNDPDIQKFINSYKDN